MSRFNFHATRAFGALVALSIVTGLTGCSANQPSTSASSEAPPEAAITFDSEYQAVLLANSQVFFGKLEGYGTRHPVLRDVYYVRTVPGAQAGAAATNALIKRGQEWHAPDVMYLNPDHIVLVEPVTSTSKVAELIAAESQQE